MKETQETTGTLNQSEHFFSKEGLSTFKLYTLEAELKIKASRIICMVNDSVTMVSIIYNHISLTMEIHSERLVAGLFCFFENSPEHA